jgi:hypothetical protein
LRNTLEFAPAPGTPTTIRGQRRSFFAAPSDGQQLNRFDHAARKAHRYISVLLVSESLYGTYNPADKRRHGSSHLFQKDLNKFYIPLPPIGEQPVIAALLDRETAKIDALTAEQQRLIALLKEKRQAAISHAVTRGLDPAAPMRTSGGSRNILLGLAQLYESLRERAQAKAEAARNDA